MAATLVHYRHLTGGAIVSYDKPSLEAAMRENTDRLYAGQMARKRKGRQHHLIEIARQVHRGILVPCAPPATAPRLPEVDADTAAEVVAEERRLKAERLERELAALRAEEGADTPDPAPDPEDGEPFVDELEMPFGQLPDALSVDGPDLLVAGDDGPSTTPTPRAARGRGRAGK